MPTNATADDRSDDALGSQHVLVTGASGFIGAAVLAALRRDGHRVRAVGRSLPAASPVRDLTWVRADLRRPDDLTGIGDGIDTVIHLARDPASSGHHATTVDGTRNLLLALGDDPRRFVLVSSLAVYDFARVPTGGCIDESTPLVESVGRDAYSTAKRLQERIVTEHVADRQLKLVIVRPGIVYGRGRLWHSHLGSRFGTRLAVDIGSQAIVPITYVDNCADAIARSVTAPLDAVETGVLAVNVVDDDLPTQREYRRVTRHCGDGPRLHVRIPYGVAIRLARFAERIAHDPDRARRLPGLLQPAVLRPRFQPMRYANVVAKRSLGWTPRERFPEVIERCLTDRAVPSAQ